MGASSAVEPLRAFLGQTLFPDPPPPPPIRRRRVLACAALAVLCIVMQLVRMWSSVPLDSVWAETGALGYRMR
jgi:hypothetical protein